MFTGDRFQKSFARAQRPRLFSRSGVCLACLVMWLLAAARLAAAPSPYAQWPNGPSTNSNFFPIGVWLQSPPNVAEFKSIGVNMYIGFFGDLDQASLTSLAASQMPLVPSQNSVGLHGSGNSIIQGWDQVDEPDNAQPNGSGGYGPCIAPSQVIASYQAIRSNDFTRPIFLNFGRGVSDINYGGRGSCTGETNYYTQASPGGDILSFDIYPISDYNGKLEMVPAGVANLVAWSGGTKPVWNFIEAAPIHGGAVPTGAQVKAEVWMSLIHGSRGIMYFVHQFSPTFREDGIFSYPALVGAVSNINWQILSLAPVLNSPNITNGFQVVSTNAAALVDGMAKGWGGSAYIFAADMRTNATAATFTVPVIQSGTATVLGENRTITVTNFQFQDSFVGYGVHLYKIDSATPIRLAAPTNLRITVTTTGSVQPASAGGNSP
jgi:hypothetical protein